MEVHDFSLKSISQRINKSIKLLKNVQFEPQTAKK